MSFVEESDYFFETLTNIKCIFLPKARFKDSSLSKSAGFGENQNFNIAGTVVPTLSQVLDYPSQSSYKNYSDCIAFSINSDKTVTYKYQLFPEDIEPIPQNVTEGSMGVYIRNLDDFTNLKPKFNNIGFNHYGAEKLGFNDSNSRSYNLNRFPDEEKRVAYDGCWTVLNWLRGNTAEGMLIADPKIGGCVTTGFSMSIIMSPNNIPEWTNKQRVVVKPRRVGDNEYELFASANNLLREGWYYILRETIFAERYWAAFPAVPQDKRDGLYIPTNTNPARTTPFSLYNGAKHYEPHKLDWNSVMLNIFVKDVKIITDCNLCMISTDNYGNPCTNGNDNFIYFFIIQPSWMFIMNQLLKDGQYNLEKNFCRAFSKNDERFYFGNDTFRNLTEQYLNDYFSRRTCGSIETTFCDKVDPITNKSNLFGADCKKICSRYDCSSQINKYCNQQGDKALDKGLGNDNICGCATTNVTFVKNAYGKYINKLRELDLSPSNCSDPEYIFNPCIKSDYKLYGDKTTNPLPACQLSGLKCYNLVNFTNSGAIDGNIDVKIDGECKSFVNTVKSGVVDCTIDSDCIQVSGSPYCIQNKCRQCKNNNDCKDGSTPLCNVVDFKCQECLKDEDCDEDEPFCKTEIGVCRVCRTDEDCKDGKICEEGFCKTECSKDSDCQDGKICINNVCKEPESKNTTLIVAVGVGVGLILLLVVFMLIRRRRSRVK